MNESFPVTYDFRELHKKLELKIENVDMSEYAQNSQRPKPGRSKF
jgi:hypothetical protein